MEKSDQTPFTELPEALVEEMLSKSESVGDRLLVKCFIANLRLEKSI